MKRGFTLLELLIVVVIIGVLAGLAIPNFIRGTERARWAESKNLLGAVRASQIRYYAQYGSFADNVSNIDVEYTTPKFFSVSLSGATNATLATFNRTGTPDPYGLGGNTISINDSGDFTYSSGVPQWLR